MTKRKYSSEVLQSVHKAAVDLHSIGAIDNETMRRFDKACLKAGRGEPARARLVD